MKRLFSIAVLGLATSAAFLWTPATSNAQTPVGVRLQVGGFGFNYNSGYPYAPYVVPAPVTTAFVPACTPAPVVVPSASYYPAYHPRTVVRGYYGPHYRHNHHHHR